MRGGLLVIGSLAACGAPKPPPQPPEQPEREPLVRITDARAFEETTLTAELVEATVARSYLAGLERCYRDALADDPALDGTLRIAFEVSATGSAYANKIVAPDVGLIGCVDGRVDGWRFAAPIAPDGQAITATFHLTFALTP